MKRNLIITVQVSFETELSTDELDNRIIGLVRNELPQVPDATPVGPYLVTIKPGPRFNFPRANLPSSDDFEVDRRRVIHKEVEDDMMWDDEDR